MSKQRDLRGLVLTTRGTSGMGRILPLDCEVLRDECPRGRVPDTGVAEAVGRGLGWPGARIDAAIAHGLELGHFVPRD